MLCMRHNKPPPHGTRQRIRLFVWADLAELENGLKVIYRDVQNQDLKEYNIYR